MFFSNGTGLVEAYDEFLLSRRAVTSPHTVRSYFYNLGRRFLPWCESEGITSLKEVNRSAIRRYMAYLAEEGLASSTRRTSAKCLQAFLNFAHREGWIKEPVSFKDLIPKARKMEPQVISPQDFAKFVEAANLRDKAALLLMADSGLRRAEVCGLKRGDIDLEGRRIRVRDGKGKEGIAYFGDVACLAILDWFEVTGWQSETPVFISLQRIAQMRALSPAGLSHVFKRLSERVGIKLTPHGLRRFFATTAHRNGMSVFDLQRAMRHSSLEQTREYTLLVDDSVARAHAAASPMDSMFEVGGDDSIQSTLTTVV